MISVSAVIPIYPALTCPLNCRVFKGDSSFRSNFCPPPPPVQLSVKQLIGPFSSGSGLSFAWLLRPFAYATLKITPTLFLQFYEDADLIVTGRAFESLLHDHQQRLPPSVSSQRGTRHHSDDGHSCFLRKWSVSNGCSLLEAVVARAAIFARMSPENKQNLMKCLNLMDCAVCMTGDGANDSAALKVAHVGAFREQCFRVDGF